MLNDPGIQMLFKSPTPVAPSATATDAAVLPSGDAVPGEAGNAPPFLQALLRSQSLLQALETKGTASSLPAGDPEAAIDGQFLQVDGKLLPSDLSPLENTGESVIVSVPADDAPAPEVATALLFSDVDQSADELSGDEGQIVNPLLQGVSDEALTDRASQLPEEAMDLMADRLVHRSPVRTPPEMAAQPQVLTATAQGAQESHPAALDKGALHLAMLENAQGVIDTQNSGLQQSTPLQGLLQPAPIQTQGTADKTFASLTMQTPMQQAQWGDEMGQQVKWLISQKMQSAELKLNPPQLGAVEIRITVQHDQVNLHFSTPHAVVKDSLEESMPRLREVLQESGLNLADVDVSQQDSTNRQNRGEEADFRAAQGSGQELADAEAEQATRVTEIRRGVVDFYA